MVKDITQDGEFPINIDGREINTPDDNILPISGNPWAKSDVQCRDLVVERIAGNVVDNPWYERALVVAV